MHRSLFTCLLPLLACFFGTKLEVSFENEIPRARPRPTKKNVCVYFMKTLNELNRLSVAELKTNYAGVCACTNAAKRTYIICMDGISSKLNQTKHVHPNRVFTPMRHICSHKNPPWKYNSINNFRAKPLAGVRQWGKSPNNSSWAKGKFYVSFK